jgi:hypothetical protein
MFDRSASSDLTFAFEVHGIYFFAITLANA